MCALMIWLCAQESGYVCIDEMAVYTEEWVCVH